MGRISRTIRGELHTVLMAFIPIFAAFVISTSATAQKCQPDWTSTFDGALGVNGSVLATTVFDDGSGPALYAGGRFVSAGGVIARFIAKWDGQKWSPLEDDLGLGTNDRVYSLAVFDDGSGPALYVGGDFTIAGGVTANHIAKWDGLSWSSLGSGFGGGNFPKVFALTVFDDGTGPSLYAGGRFTTAGGAPASRIAKWNGQSWSSLGAGVGDDMYDGVYTMTVFEENSGSALYVGGAFTEAGGAPTSNIARWDGKSWSPLGSGIGGVVRALTVFDDGTGPALIVGGSFFSGNGSSANIIAKWDGQSWSPLGGGTDGLINSFVHDLAVFDDGSGSALYATGQFYTAGGVAVNKIAKWDGRSWSTLGRGLAGGGFDGLRGFTLTAFDDDSGPALFVGGSFSMAGGKTAKNIARWDGQSWSPLGHGMSGPVYSLAVFDDGAGPALFASGVFVTTTGDVAANHIARWDGSSWAPLGGGLNGVGPAMTVFDDGSGLALYASGSFANGYDPANPISRWDGVSWSSVGSGLNGGATSLVVFDDGSGPALFAGGGQFINSDGIQGTNVAKWDGKSWSFVGSGFNEYVATLTVFDDGTGAALYAGGGFTTASGVKANAIAKWDGLAWTSVGEGLVGDPDPLINLAQSGLVFALAVFDDGSGPALYAGGDFSNSGSVPVDNIARWDGQAWAPVGTGIVDGQVNAMTVFDDGSGSALYIGGYTPTGGITRWDGQAFTPVGSGTVGAVNTMTVFDDGSGPALFAGGGFFASPAGDSFLAKYQGCAVSNPADLNGDGVVNGADLAALLIQWGTNGSADLNTDGVVNGADISILLVNWSG